MTTSEDRTRVVVLGAGPGGYAAAFQAADLGMDVTLVDDSPQPGGVCLYRGCIPSKALLHVASLIHESRAAAEWGERIAMLLVFGAGLGEPLRVELVGVRPQLG